MQRYTLRINKYYGTIILILGTMRFQSFSYQFFQFLLGQEEMDDEQRIFPITLRYSLLVFSYNIALWALEMPDT